MKQPQRILTFRTLARTVFFVVIVPFLPLLISWEATYWEAWVYAIVSILSFSLSRAIAARRHPDLLAERARFMQHENTRDWDRILVLLIGVGGILVVLAAGLEARFKVLPVFGMPVKILSLIVILAGYALTSYALIENRFFSGMVRIQTERGHRVVSSGPYRWIRHPGYAGALLTYLATPFFLDAPWSLLPTLLLVITLVIRTSLEDKTLQEELDGNQAYADRVRYRLLPGVW